MNSVDFSEVLLILFVLVDDWGQIHTADFRAE